MTGATGRDSDFHGERRTEGSGIGVTPLELARAVLALLPQRVAPSEEEIARAIFDVRDGDLDVEEWEETNWETRERYECDARAVQKLYASQPTVAEVRARAAQQTLDSYRITDAVRDVAYERATHAERGWTPEHDAEHGVNHLERLAIERLGFVPQDRGELVKAASLLIAAIELIDRQEVDHG